VDDKMFTDLEVAKEEVELFKIASADELKVKRAKEVDLIHAFKSKPSKATFMPLYQSFKPLIISAAKRNMFGSPIPQAAHMMNASQNFLDAVKGWKPDKGGFTTYMYSTVFNGGKRLNLKYQNIGYIPEARATKYQAFQTAQHILREQLGREPSTVELADEMAMPPAEVERMRKEVRQDLILNDSIPTVGPGFAQSDKAMQVFRDLQYSLMPKHRVVLEHATGINGVTPLLKKTGGPDVQAISRAAKISVPEVRSALKTISRKTKEFRGTIGSAHDLDTLIDGDTDGSN
jgi:hypothetical protein